MRHKLERCLFIRNRRVFVTCLDAIVSCFRVIHTLDLNHSRRLRQFAGLGLNVVDGEYSIACSIETPDPEVQHRYVRNRNGTQENNSSYLVGTLSAKRHATDPPSQCPPTYQSEMPGYSLRHAVRR